jgi:hypothetical protein
MSTARTCTTPEDGWALYSHFLGNYLLLINMQGEGWSDRNKDEANKDKRERIIEDSWLKLAGALYMIMRRMKLNGHDDVAAQMQQIVDMVVEQDVTDPAVRKAIHAKADEFNAGRREFKAELERLRTERAVNA